MVGRGFRSAAQQGCDRRRRQDLWYRPMVGKGRRIGLTDCGVKPLFSGAAIGRVARPRAEHRPGRAATRGCAIRVPEVKRFSSHAASCIRSAACPIVAAWRGLLSRRAGTPPPFRDGGATRPRQLVTERLNYPKITDAPPIAAWRERSSLEAVALIRLCRRR
jgi:hypothetical protein